MATAYSGKATSAMAQIVKERVSGQPLPPGSSNEGALSGYIGVKPEDKGPFSLSLGKTAASQLLFQLFIESVRIVTDDERPNL